jgi:hypothetical protein
MGGGHYAASLKVAGSITDELIGLILPALGSTQRLTEMSTWNLSGVQRAAGG